MRVALTSARLGRVRPEWAAITWVVLALLAVGERLLQDRSDPLLRDLSVHARLLLALPLLLVAERVMARVCRDCVDRLLTQRFVLAREAKRFDGLVHHAEGLRDSAIAAWVLLALALATGVVGFFGLDKPIVGLAVEKSPTVVRAYYYFVALPTFQFALFRQLWRWVVWIRFLAGLSHLELQLQPAHPDLAGGIGFVSRPSLAFGVVLFAVSLVLSAAWAAQVLFGGARLAAFTPLVAGYLLFGQLLALGPLLVFTRRLVSARFRGDAEYGGLALTYVQQFHRRWIVSRDDASLLGSSDIQSLADMATSFSVVQRMRAVPFAPSALATLAVAAAMPMLPLVLTVMPVDEVLRKLAQTIMGGVI